MNISITFKNFEPSDHLRKYAQRRFDKLARFLKKVDEIEISVVLSVIKFRHKADVNVTGDGLTLAAYEESEDMYATIDLVYDKILAQIKKANELRIDKHQKGTKIPMEFFRYRTAGSGKERTIVSSDKRFEPKPLFDDEAALQVEQRADDEFLVFLNAETEHINIIYRRKNGQFGLIDVGS